MAKKELSQIEIAESIPDLWMPLTPTQREYLAKNFTIQKFKKNEIIYCEGETPMHLMCLLSGKVKIYKDGAEYMTVMLTDADKQEDNKRHKQIALKNNGTYRIVETDWSWAYNNSGSKEITRVLSTTSTEAERTFLFTNVSDESAPIHSESLKINKMNISN